MPHPLVLVCVTGPESTGKTTLARHLAEWLDTEWVPDGARDRPENRAAMFDLFRRALARH